jgi:deoxyribodipyrimidine photolyase-like uncharacterized protein
VWVELPDVAGMILPVDKGSLASQPYGASGAHADRVSTIAVPAAST